MTYEIGLALFVGFMAGFVPAWFHYYADQAYGELRNPLYVFRQYYFGFPGNTIKFFFGRFIHLGYGGARIVFPWDKRY